MKRDFKNRVAFFSAILVFHVIVVDMAMAAPSQPKMKITKNDPVIVTSPQEAIPFEKQEGGESFIGKNKWWILLGLVAAGGAAALAGGGGGGGDSSDNDDDSNNNNNNSGDTGNVTVSWQD